LIGALLGIGIMLGAISLHTVVLVIEVKNDGGELFTLAIITLLCCTILIFQNLSKISDLLRFKTKN